MIFLKKMFIISLIFLCSILFANEDSREIQDKVNPTILAQIGELAQEITSGRRTTFSPLLCSDQTKINIANIYSDNENCSNFITNKLYNYEELMAKSHPDLTIEEIKSILVNFSKEFVLTGDTGLIKKEGEKNVYVSTDTGLIYSYKDNIKKINIDIGITPEDINRIRQDAFNFDSERRNKGTEGKVYISTDPISDDTVTELNDKMGYTVIPYTKLNLISDPRCKNSPSFKSIKRDTKKKKMEKFLCIIYPGEEKVKELLEQFTKEINKKIQSYKLNSQDKNLKNQELADLMTYAVRNLLLIHPFSDGSGRTARLLGQILFKKLTGKEIVFPSAFFQEMNYSHAELKEILNNAIIQSCFERKHQATQR